MQIVWKTGSSTTRSDRHVDNKLIVWTALVNRWIKHQIYGEKGETLKLETNKIEH
jgi:hypothetical protein